MRDAPLLNLVLALGLVLMIGWLLVIGQAIILPVVMAIIAVYVVTTAADALEPVPLIGRLPSVARHGLVLLGFLSLGCGLVLDAVSRGRKELKRLAYLACSAPVRHG